MPINAAAAIQTTNLIQQNRALFGLSVRRASSGNQITRAADNPAGLAIAQALQAELGSQTQAIRNVNSGVSIVQTAEGGLANIQNQLGRLRELAVQGSSDTLGASQRAALNEESNSILQELNRVASVTQFNGQNLLDGSLANGISVQAGTGATASDTIGLSIADSRTAALGITGTDQLSSAATSQSFLTDIDTALGAVNQRRATLGATQKRLGSAASNLSSSQASTASARSSIADADLAVQAAVLARTSILQSVGASILTQINDMNQSAISLVQ